jgi:DnaJ-class molecular chaperone
MEAGVVDIKGAYKKLALEFHPDKRGGDVSEKDKEIWLKV